MSEINRTPRNQLTEHPRFVEGSHENEETLEKFTNELEIIQEENPEIVGATLFGSRLKGESTAKSDVDTVIFIDAAQLKEHGITVEIDEQGNIVPGDFTKYTKEFKEHIGKRLANSTNKDPETITGGLFIAPIDDELIKKSIDQVVTYHQQYQEYKQEFEEWVENRSWDDESEGPKPPEWVGLNSAIGQLFHPALLSGLDEYRQEVIGYLKQQGSFGEKVWQDDILGKLSFGEGHLKTSDQASYPINLDEAGYWYGREK